MTDVVTSVSVRTQQASRLESSSLVSPEVLPEDKRFLSKTDFLGILGVDITDETLGLRITQSRRFMEMARLLAGWQRRDETDGRVVVAEESNSSDASVDLNYVWFRFDQIRLSNLLAPGTLETWDMVIRAACLEQELDEG